MYTANISYLHKNEWSRRQTDGDARDIRQSLSQYAGCQRT